MKATCLFVALGAVSLGLFAPDMYRGTVQRVSYFIVITALLVIWHGYSEWRKEHKR